MNNTIAKYRVIENLSYSDIAKLISVTPHLVEMWEKSIQQPNINQSIALCNLFKISLDELFYSDIELLRFSNLNLEFRKSIYNVYDNFVSFNEGNNKRSKEIVDEKNSKITFQRRKLGLTQEKLANKLGVSRSLVRDWESKYSTPSLEYIFSMAYIFNVSFEYFVNDNVGVDELNLNYLSDDQKKVLQDLVSCYTKMNLKK